MVTWQDLVEVGEFETDKMVFVRNTIRRYQAEEFYKTAKIADEYDRRRNPDIQGFVKTLYTVTGKVIPDTYSSDYKVGRGFFPYFITQETQYLLGNGINWEKNETSDRLGTRKAPFDSRVQEAGHAALSGGCSYGFWNLDHIEVFTALEFVPLFDEENGALRAGIRYWQIDAGKPFRATLYEEDGYTEYIWDRKAAERNGEGEVLREKRPYIISVTGTDVDDEKIYHGENYPAFPIVPLWGNKRHQSEIVGLRDQFFVYDMIKSGFCNSVEDASYVYWAVHNAPGMDERDLADFLARVRRLHVSVVEDAGAVAEPHVIETPYQSREELLTRLEKDLFKDAMAFDPDRVANGATTATQIKAAYENLELKCNDFEYCVLSFINGILELAGVDDNPTFTRSKNINVNEEVQVIMSASAALDEEYVTRKILTILGDGDQAEEIIKRKIDDEVTRQRETELQLARLQNEEGQTEEEEEEE